MYPMSFTVSDSRNGWFGTPTASLSGRGCDCWRVKLRGREEGLSRRRMAFSGSVTQPVGFMLFTSVLEVTAVTWVN